MNLRRAVTALRDRRGNLALLALSLLLAVFLREAYSLSQNHPVTVQCRIRLSSDLTGYEAESLSEEVLYIDGQAKGFDVRRFRASSNQPVEVPVYLESNYLTPSPDRDDLFTVRSQDLTASLMEYFGGDFEVGYVQDATLSFEFLRQTYKMVPVAVRSSISFAPQYMASAPVSVIPDSVSVYGRERDLALINQVSTRLLSLSGVDKSVRGSLRLIPPQGFRIGRDRVEFVVETVRYVEMSFDVEVVPVKVPANRQVSVYPSRVKVICKVPYGTRLNTPSGVSCVVDYRRLAMQRGSKMVPEIESTDFEILSYRIEPQMVECFVKRI